MNGVGEKVVTVAVAITGVAMLALLVSKNANTAGVIKSAGNAFSQSLGVALSPVTSGGNNLSGFQPTF